jgi:hypothetical protein
MGGLHVRSILAEAVLEAIVERTKVTGEPSLRAVVRGHVFVSLVDTCAFEVVVNSLVVTIYPLPLITT